MTELERQVLAGSCVVCLSCPSFCQASFPFSLELVGKRKLLEQWFEQRMSVQWIQWWWTLTGLKKKLKWNEKNPMSEVGGRNPLVLSHELRGLLRRPGRDQVLRMSQFAAALFLQGSAEMLPHLYWRKMKALSKDLLSPAAGDLFGHLQGPFFGKQSRQPSLLRCAAFCGGALLRMCPRLLGVHWPVWSMMGKAQSLF